jgi:ATP-dependent Clp protease ATP-binding subunit ClpB
VQLLDDGRLTDAQGRTVDFRNTVVVMTSNIGSQHLLAGVTGDGEIKDDARTAVINELPARFRPEFLNRVDDIVLFKPLTLPEIEKVVDLLVADLHRRLADRQLRLELTEAARRHIAAEGFDPVYGARPLRRYLQRGVETRIGRALLSGDGADGSTVIVDHTADTGLSVTWTAPTPAQVGRVTADIRGAVALRVHRGTGAVSARLRADC